MSKQFCTWVELNQKGVYELLQDTSKVVEETAQAVASKSGGTVEMGTRSKRPIAFVSQPYSEASKNNNLVKALFGSKK